MVMPDFGVHINDRFSSDSRNTSLSPLGPVTPVPITLTCVIPHLQYPTLPYLSTYLSIMSSPKSPSTESHLEETTIAMDLFFSNDDILRTNIMTSDGRLLYVVETPKKWGRKGDTVISRLNGQYKIQVGRINWHMFSESQAACHGQEIHLEKTGFFSRCKGWRAADYGTYIWKVGAINASNRKHPTLVADNERGRTIATFHPGSKGFLTRRQKQPPSLAIAPGFSLEIVDEFVTTFIKFEQDKRDHQERARDLEASI